MKNFNNDKILRIKLAADKINGGMECGTTTPFTAPYLFSTENLVDSYNIIKPANKTMLTVASSGDHAFDAYMQGAARVDTFDFNIMQECVFCLKADLIRRMNYNQFMNFFFGTLLQGRISDSFGIIRPFIQHLSHEGRELINHFYNSPEKHMFFRHAPFRGSTLYDYKRNKIAYIKSEGNFNTLKQRLPDEINFTLADTETVAKNITGPYDIIHLSNVLSAYVNNFPNENNGFNEFYSETIRAMANRLHPGGVMVANYLWDANFDDRRRYPYNQNFSNTIKSQPDLTHSVAEFESVRCGLGNDALVLIHKTR